jgi:uncharacterized protein YabE (DUF348 family)
MDALMNFIMKMIALLVGPVALAAGGANINNLPVESANVKYAQAYFVEEYLPDGSAGQTFSGKSGDKNLFQAVTEVGANPYPEDKLAPFFSKDFVLGARVAMYRAPVYEVYDGKRHTTYRSWTKTVGELLSEKKIELGQDDKINFATDFPIENGITIRITRVAHTQVVENQDIDFNIVKKDDPNLDKGKTSVKQAGKKGQKALTYAVTREDGVEVSRVLIKTEVVSDPIDQILMVGTKPVITIACRFNDTVIAASLKYGTDPNSLCYRMMAESHGNPLSDGGDYKGLFQYSSSLWDQISPKAGYSGASIWDSTAQIYTTAWAWTHGYRGRWPSP